MPQQMLSAEQKRLLRFRLTTAEITYRLPDYPTLLQQYIWQDLDIDPHFPVLTRFLLFWQTSLDGKVHTVRVASTALVKPAEFRFADALLTPQ